HCSLCELVRGEDNAEPWAKQSDVVYRDVHVIAWINPKWWGRIEGNAVVVPTEHVENIFDLEPPLAAEIHRVARDVATAMIQTYGCAGISTRQHNGPEGNQEVWHYHLHVFPRFHRDDLYKEPFRIVPQEARLPYAERLREWFASR
ncbi:MAG: HIT family protein, partial [Actinomycetota bacterium]